MYVFWQSIVLLLRGNNIQCYYPISWDAFFANLRRLYASILSPLLPQPQVERTRWSPPSLQVSNGDATCYWCLFVPKGETAEFASAASAPLKSNKLMSSQAGNTDCNVYLKTLALWCLNKINLLCIHHFLCDAIHNLHYTYTYTIPYYLLVCLLYIHPRKATRHTEQDGISVGGSVTYIHTKRRDIQRERERERERNIER